MASFVHSAWQFGLQTAHEPIVKARPQLDAGNWFMQVPMQFASPWQLSPHCSHPAQFGSATHCCWLGEHCGFALASFCTQLTQTFSSSTHEVDEGIAFGHALGTPAAAWTAQYILHPKESPVVVGLT
jgi:hypothetical protein